MYVYCCFMASLRGMDISLILRLKNHIAFIFLNSSVAPDGVGVGLRRRPSRALDAMTLSFSSRYFL